MKNIYFKIYTVSTEGGYIGGRELGRGPGAKGVDIAPSWRHYVPAWVAEIPKSWVYNYNRYSTLPEGEYIHTYALRENVKLGEVPTLEGYVWMEWDEHVPTGIYLIKELERENIIPVNNPYAESILVALHEEQNKAAEERSRQIEEFYNIWTENFKVFESKYKELNLKLKFFGDTADIMVNTSDYATKVQIKIGSTFERIDLELKKAADAVEEKAAKKAALEKAEKERIARGEIAELSTGELLVLQNGVIKAPKWSLPHLIGSGGAKIKAVQDKIGRKVTLIGYDAPEPKKAWAKWLI